MEPLRIPGTLDALGVIREYIKLAAVQSGLDKKQSYGLQLAVDEIATNIVVHGYDEPGLSGDIVVDADVTDESLTITLEDSAIPYDPLDQSLPDDLATPLDERKVGGLGVFLAKQNVDQFLYKFKDGRNYNIFVISHTVNAPVAPE